MTKPKQIVAAVPVGNLATHPDNPRRGDIDAIVASIEHNGWFGTIVAQRSTGHVLAGNHRFIAAQRLGHKTVPVYYVDVDDDAARRIMLADNRTAELATYDDGLLLDVLTELDDLEGTGWDDDDRDLLEALVEQADNDPVDDASPTEQRISEIRERVSAGDIWQVGRHRVMCGDCRNADDVASLVDGSMMNVVFTSPPYADRRKYDETTEFKPIHPDDYVEWFSDVASCSKDVVDVDGSMFINIKPNVTKDGLDTELYVNDLVSAYVREWGWHWVTEFCWERNGVPKNVARRFKNQFEPIYHFSAGVSFKFIPENVRVLSNDVPRPGGPGVGNTSWGQSGTNVAEQGTGGSLFGASNKKRNTHETGFTGNETASDMQGRNWDVGESIGVGMAYPGNRLPTFAGSHQAWGHPAAFPVGLAGFFVQAYTDIGDHVYDPFAGSGSTMIAAGIHDRVGYGMEISPGYCDIILERLETQTGETPVKMS